MAQRKTTSKRPSSKTTKAKRAVVQPKRAFNFGGRHVLAIAVALAVAAVGVYTLTRSHADTLCTADDKLVNSCRAWFGATVGGYPQVTSDNAAQYAYGEKRLNNPNALTDVNAATTITNKYDLIHRYHSPTQTSFDDNEKMYYGRDNTYLYINWKPDTIWKNAAGGNATDNTRIDAMADSIKALGSKKIFLTVFHEPENDVSSGNCTTNASSAASGSPTDYVNMWHNVRSRFDAKGVSNVVWTMNYMSYPTWNCLVPLLWPGNSYVDWLTFDPYGGGNSATIFKDSVDPFYNYLTQNSNTDHDYLSKPWGLAEHGAWANGGTTQTSATNYWNQAEQAVKNNLYPKLKMYMTFDTSSNGSSQVGLDFSGQPNIPEQTAYNAFATAVLTTTNVAAPAPDPTPAPAPTPTPPPAKDTTAPTITATAPKTGTTVKGTITTSATAKDNVKMASVTLIVDGNWVATDTTSPYSFSLNTKKFKNGKHNIVMRAWDAAGNHADAKTISATIKN